MPDVFETYESGDVDSPENGKGGGHGRHYKVLGEPSSATAIALVRALAPVAVQVGDDVLVRQSIQLKPFPIDNWEATVPYGPEDDPKSQQRPEPGFWKFRFRTSGGTVTIRHAPMISRHWTNTGTEAPESDSIDFDGKQVKGVAIPLGALGFAITAYYEPREVTIEFMKRLALATGRVSTDEFLGFEIGSIRYLGCDGEGDIPTVAGQRVQPIPITHDFEFSENDDDVVIDGINQHRDASGQPIEKIRKKGWEYVSVRDITKKDEDTNTLKACGHHVYVHDPHKKLNFTEFFGFRLPSA